MNSNLVVDTLKDSGLTVSVDVVDIVTDTELASAIAGKVDVATLAADNSASVINYKFYSALVNTQKQPVDDVLEGRVTLEDFYLTADGADYSPALQRAFTHAASLEKFSIHLQCKTYTFNSPVSYNGSAQLRIVGQYGTILKFQDTSNSTALSITSTRRISLSDFDVETAPPLSGSRVSIKLNCTIQDHAFDVRNIRSTYVITTPGTGVIAWDFVNPSLSLFHNLYVRGFGTSIVGSSNNIAYRVSATSKISTDSTFVNCSAINLEYALIATPPVGGVGGAYLEGLTFYNCTFVGVMEGLYIVGDNSNPYRSPMYRWIGGHINAYRRCVFLYWVSQIAISDAHFYLTYDSAYSGSLGLFPVWFEQTVECRIHNTGIQLMNQPNGLGAHGVHVGPGCVFTSVLDVSCATATAAYCVVSYAGGRVCRVGNCTTFYSGLPPAGVFSQNATTDVDLGGNAFYPQ